jgi:hypothetical protein
MVNSLMGGAHMKDEPLGFVQFNVIYTRQGLSNQWTRRVERKAAATKEIGVPMFTVLHEGESVKDEKRIHCAVNIKCDPLLNDPKTIITTSEVWRPYEEDAVNLTDKKFKKRHPEAELTALP